MKATRTADDDSHEEKGSRKPNPVDIHVGGRVRFRRMLLGMSQEKLGERLGLTFQQVQKYEKGINRIGASRLYDLSQVLNVPVQFFYDEAPVQYEQGMTSREVAAGFAESGNTPGESYITEFLNTREGLELNKAFVKIGEAKTRRAIVELVRSLAGDQDPEV